MTSQAQFLKALSAAPAVPLDDSSIAGLPSGEFALAALWSIADRWRQRMGDDFAANIKLCTRNHPFKPCLAPGTIRCHRGCG